VLNANLEEYKVPTVADAPSIIHARLDLPDPAANPTGAIDEDSHANNSASVSRLIPGVLGGSESTSEESHSGNLLEYPHYPRPPEFRNWRVPDILLSGNHVQIARWRRKESLRRTRERRPDLFAKLDLSSKSDMKLLKELDEEGSEQH